jgi:hypothetical protein
MGRGRPLCHKGQLEVVDNSVHHSIVGEEGYDLHLSAALGADHRVHFIDLPARYGALKLIYMIAAYSVIRLFRNKSSGLLNSKS